MSSCTESEAGNQRKPLAVLVVVGFFLIGIIVPIALNSMDGYRAMRSAWPRNVQYLIHPLFRMILVLIGWLILCSICISSRRPTLGLLVGWKQGLKGFAIGVLCSLPMLILGLVCDRNSISRDLIHSTIVPGLTEEIFYRAFAFGMFVQVLRLKLWPAAILTGLIFGLAHLISASVRAQPIMDQVGWIGMIAIGGLFYAWIYERANWNLWVVIALHAAMNLWWDMFDLTSSPIGNIGATLSRILAVGLAIYFVVFRGVLRPPRSDAGSTIRA
tara:strand:+ start:246266 stop:247081 length:816 start_codon:yes stop_codon:yes gene_type:complete